MKNTYHPTQFISFIISIKAVICSLSYLAWSTLCFAEVNIYSDSGWSTSISGSLPVFAVASDHEGSESAFRVQSGFNPANINFHIIAPTTESGLTISGHIQVDSHLNAPNGLQNGGMFESRVANIQILGDFGIVTLGKDFGVFNSNAIGDIASQSGVGWLGSDADAGNATGGRIGTGYVYANFNPQIKFTSNDIDGFVLKVAIINPEEPQDASVQTSLPRFEGQITYFTDGFKVWAGAFQQKISVQGEHIFDYSMEGFDVGAHLQADKFGLTLNFTDTTGIGADGVYGGSINDFDVDATQWYIEADYKTNKSRFGVSYGEGSQDPRAADIEKDLKTVPEVKNKLTMLFLHYYLSEQFRIISELQHYQSDIQNNYKAVILGFQFDF